MTLFSGIYRAAFSERQTVYCSELQAYISIPAVPSKYIKWLRQRRAVTKEVRNMTKIGRHRNVVHLFEVLELIQETKSTMFLILELVRGGELFDLISSNAAKITSHDVVPKGFTESETVMRKFFVELVSGIHYCHSNFIAHRDLKPENLLVHYDSTKGTCTLKIADFGLSATFGVNGEAISDGDTIESGGSVVQTGNNSENVESPAAPVSPIKQQMDKIFSVGGTAISFFTCGVVDDVICGPQSNWEPAPETEIRPMTLKRMTSVVGSPHYVAPEIISQHEKKSKKKSDLPEQIIRGYDGTLADVWSAGVILYAMLFRSLPFGEDLLRCPRFQSYKKWYDDIRMTGGPRCRRGSVLAPLNPVITRIEEQEFLGPHWFFPSESSPESRDLIVYMLNPDPDRRPTIQLVLRHPWLIKNGAAPSLPTV
jgi:serine/threonine protein kinase